MHPQNMSNRPTLRSGDGDALDRQPVGTHIEHNGVRYIKHEDGWSHGSIHRYGAELALSGPSYILHLPESTR